jgi:hypothetical protein
MLEFSILGAGIRRFYGLRNRLIFKPERSTGYARMKWPKSSSSQDEAYFEEELNALEQLIDERRRTLILISDPQREKQR